MSGLALAAVAAAMLTACATGGAPATPAVLPARDMPAAVTDNGPAVPDAMLDALAATPAPPTPTLALRPPSPVPGVAGAPPSTPTASPSASPPPPGPTAPARTAVPSPATGQLPRAPALDCTPHSFPQRTQHSFAVDPTDDRRLYIGVEQEGFFKSVDGGATWLRSSTGIRAWGRLNAPGLCYEEFYATIIDPKDPARLCIAMAGGPGTTSTMSSAGNNGVYCSRDAGATWEQRVSPTMNTAVYALAADPRNFDVMYAGVNGGACSNGPPVCAAGTYFNTTGAIYKTADGGRTWTELDTLYFPDLRVPQLAVDQRNPQTVIAATFGKVSGQTGGFGGARQIGVLRSVDGGRTWTSSLRGMTDDPREQGLLALDAAPQNASQVYVTASSNNSYWSGDGGQTFTKARRMAAFAFDPHDPAGLHLLGCNGESIQESRDGGKTWVVKSPTPGFVAFDKGVPTHVTWSKTDPNVVYLAGPYATVFRSSDGGATWSQVLSADRLPG